MGQLWARPFRLSAVVANPLALTARIAEALRDRIIAGELLPGQRLSETALAGDLAVSRNTLREVFRLLTKEGLLHHEPNRGVFVSVPSAASILDIYRVRRMLECQALAQAYPGHPAAARMAEAVAEARARHAEADWQGVGSANMRFHAAVVDLADSQRLSSFYAQVAAELRLCFGQLDDPERLHAPYIEMNASILAELEAGRPEEASRAMERYLVRSERMILAALARLSTS
ncbi:hypothetical protein M673_18700 (plasmid) [Aureimonas sp. AU20]|nr:hypothetical protein M673_18700 [Aureimonas sp. AU20]